MDVRVWIVEAPAVATEAAPLLTEDETERAGRFAVVPARDLFLASRALQRTLGGRLLGIDPQQVRFDRTCVHCGHEQHGRPRLAASPSLDYSVSHSGTLVALAFAWYGQVGLDLEANDRRTDFIPLIPRIATAVEQEQLAGLVPDDCRRACQRLWTRKEAVAKLTGHGLALPFTELSADGPTATAHPPPAGWPPAPIRLRDLRVGPGYTAALASSPEPAEVTVHRVTSLDQVRLPDRLTS